MNKLTEWFVLNFHDKTVTRTQNPLTISGHSEPEPDLLLPRRKEEGYKDAHPTPEDVLLIVEVVESSIEKGRHIKLPLYASAGIPDCWLVDLPEQSSEVHTQPTTKGYAQIHIYRPGGTVESSQVKGLEVSDVL